MGLQCLVTQLGCQDFPVLHLCIIISYTNGNKLMPVPIIPGGIKPSGEGLNECRSDTFPDSTHLCIQLMGMCPMIWGDWHIIQISFNQKPHEPTLEKGGKVSVLKTERKKKLSK